MSTIRETKKHQRLGTRSRIQQGAEEALCEEKLKKLRLNRSQERKWREMQKEEESVRVCCWNVAGINMKARDIMVSDQLALARPIPDLTLLQESHLTRKWKPEQSNARMFKF